MTYKFDQCLAWFNAKDYQSNLLVSKIELNQTWLLKRENSVEFVEVW